MKRNTIFGVIAVLVILGSVLFFTRGNGDYNSSLKPSEALGEVLARETAAIINQPGRIVLIEWALKPDQLPRSSEQVNHYKKILKKQKGISIAHSHSISAEGPIMGVLGSGVPGPVFLQLLQKYPDADAIVSFVGAPSFSPQQLETLKTPRPKLLVVDVPSIEKVARPPGIPIEDLIQTGVIDLAVVSTTGDTANLRGSSKPRGGNFDPHFKIITADDPAARSDKTN